MEPELRRLLERILADIAGTVDAYLGKRITLTTWQRAMEETIGDGHRAAYLLGADTRTLSPQARDYLARTIAEQVKYLTGFTQDIRSEHLSEAMMKARAALYAGSLKATWSRAKWWGWPLPFHPTEKCECHTSCQCRWVGTDLDKEKMNGDFAWTFGEAEHCPTCVTRHKHNPYLVRKGKLQ